MKKLIFLGIFAVMCLGCASSNKNLVGNVQIPNPISPSSKAEIQSKLGLTFAIPKDATDVRYSIIANKTAQADFLWRGSECCVRVEPTSSTEPQDISGFYYKWSNEERVSVGYNSAVARWVKTEGGESLGTCFWLDMAPGILYSVSMRQNASKALLEELATAVYIPLQGNVD